MSIFETTTSLSVNDGVLLGDLEIVAIASVLILLVLVVAVLICCLAMQRDIACITVNPNFGRRYSIIGKSLRRIGTSFAKSFRSFRASTRRGGNRTDRGGNRTDRGIKQREDENDNEPPINYRQNKQTRDHRGASSYAFVQENQDEFYDDVPQIQSYRGSITPGAKQMLPPVHPSLPRRTPPQGNSSSPKHTPPQIHSTFPRHTSPQGRSSPPRRTPPQLHSSSPRQTPPQSPSQRHNSPQVPSSPWRSSPNVHSASPLHNSTPSSPNQPRHTAPTRHSPRHTPPPQHPTFPRYNPPSTKHSTLPKHMKEYNIHETFDNASSQDEADDYEEMTPESWDIGEESRKQVEARLEGEEKGKFYVRRSKGKLIISVKDDDKIRHIEITEVDGEYTGDNHHYFGSIKQMVDYYQIQRIPNFNIILAQH